MRQCVKVLLIIWGSLIGAHLCTLLLAIPSNYIAIFPRDTSQLWGLLSYPIFHGSWSHLFHNLISFSVLFMIMWQISVNRLLRLIVVAWLISGLITWGIGRTAYHLGMSGLVYAMWLYLIVYGIALKRIRLMLLSLFLAFYFSSFWFGLIPLEANISYELHALGALCGLFMAYFDAKTQKISEQSLKKRMQDELSS